MLSPETGNKLTKYISDYVIFDLETTGISYVSDQVVEISAIKVKNGVVTDEFSTLVNPMRHIPRQASAVNGITDDMVADAPVFEAALRDFLDFVGDMVLVGHNIAAFDMKFIYRDSIKYFGQTVGNDYIDTLQISRMCLPSLRHHTLSDLADYYHIDTAGAHRALNDCRMNQQVFERLGEVLKSGQGLARRRAGAVAFGQGSGIAGAAECGNAGTGSAGTVNNPPVGEIRVCPRCGNLLKMINGKFGDFWGCTGYPNCRYTENV